MRPVEDEIMYDLSSYLSLVITALEAINKIVGSATVDKAADVLGTVQAICKAVQEAKSGEVSPQVAKEQLNALLAALKDNDAAADAALADKFKGKDQPGT